MIGRPGRLSNLGYHSAKFPPRAYRNVIEDFKDALDIRAEPLPQLALDRLLVCGHKALPRRNTHSNTV